jgi:hypothetical protein
MAIVLEGLVIPTFILAVIYFFLSLYGWRRLLYLHDRAANLTTKKLFVMSCLLTSLLRCISFFSTSTMNYLKINIVIDTSGDLNDSEDFLDKASLVIFDLPDFCIISAYVLLIVVWAEAMVMSRRHWLSTVSIKKNWILFYVVFNTVLYCLQVSLYSFLFVPSIDKVIHTSYFIALFSLWCLFRCYVLAQPNPYPASALTLHTHTPSRVLSAC